MAPDDDGLENPDLGFHDSAWFVQQIDMSEDWVRRNRPRLPHHRIGRLVKFDAHCVEIFREQTAVVPQDEMRRTPLSQARDRTRRR